MTDGKDGKQLEDGIVSDANQDNSNSNNGQQSSSTVTDTAKQIALLQRQVDALSRSLQSGKDKAVAKTNQRLDGLEKDLRAVLQSAAQKGQTIQEVLTEIDAEDEAYARQELLELARSVKSGQISFGQPSGIGEPSGVDVAKVLSDLELDENDMRVKEFRSRKFASDVEAYREGAKLAKTISAKQPTDVNKPSPVGRNNITASGMEALQQEYDSRSKDLRGQALINLKMEMRKKGLNIY